jgi:hypothetical protein
VSNEIHGGFGLYVVKGYMPIFIIEIIVHCNVWSSCVNPHVMFPNSTQVIDHVIPLPIG